MYIISLLKTVHVFSTFTFEICMYTYLRLVALLLSRPLFIININLFF